MEESGAKALLKLLSWLNFAQFSEIIMSITLHDTLVYKRFYSPSPSPSGHQYFVESDKLYLQPIYGRSRVRGREILVHFQDCQLDILWQISKFLSGLGHFRISTNKGSKPYCRLKLQDHMISLWRHWKGNRILLQQKKIKSLEINLQLN